MSVFETTDRFPGAPPRIRRSLGNVNVASPDMVALVAACRASKAKFSAPGWSGGVWAHVVFPDHKVAVIIKNFTESRRLNSMREEWERLGWTCADIDRRTMSKTADEQLASDLADLLKSKRAKR